MPLLVYSQGQLWQCRTTWFAPSKFSVESYRTTNLDYIMVYSTEEMADQRAKMKQDSLCFPSTFLFFIPESILQSKLWLCNLRGPHSRVKLWWSGSIYKDEGPPKSGELTYLIYTALGKNDDFQKRFSEARICKALRLSSDQGVPSDSSVATSFGMVKGDLEDSAEILPFFFGLSDLESAALGNCGADWRPPVSPLRALDPLRQIVYKIWVIIRYL